MTDGNQTTQIPTQQAVLDAALVALRPIAALLLDAGISAHELSRIARRACIEEATSRQEDQGARPTVSSIAAATGLSRADVRHAILDLSLPKTSNGLKPRATDKLLAAWNSDPDFLDSHGSPRPLKYSENEPNFSSLAKRYAANMPPRAMLNVMLSSKTVMATDHGTYVPTTPDSRIDHPETSVTYFGAKIGALGSTLLQNMKEAENRQLFDALILSSVDDDKKIAKIFRELDRRCRTFSQSVERYLIDEAISEGENVDEQHTESLGIIVAVVRGAASSSPANNPQEDDVDY